jgi:hypothetical protein
MDLEIDLAKSAVVHAEAYWDKNSKTYELVLETETGDIKIIELSRSELNLIKDIEIE